MKLKTMAQFRVGLLAATLLTCGFALPITLTLWVIGEILNVMGGNSKV